MVLRSLKARTGSVILAGFMALGLMPALMPQQAYADSTVTVNISSQADLTSWLASGNTGSNVVVNLNADGLDVTSPLASFAGTFNGNGNTLDLAISTAANNTAFIGELASTGKIDSVNFSGSVTSTTTGDYVAAVVGYNSGAITNVANAASVTGASAYNVGGIAGFNNVGTIANCSNAGAVKGLVKVGGIVGENAGTVKDCANTAAVTSDYNRKCGIGGIAGRNGNNNTATETGIIKNCTNSGNVICEDGSWVGGIAGFQNALSSTEGCTISEDCVIRGYKYVDDLIGNDEGTTTATTPVTGGTATLNGGTAADLQAAIAKAGADGTIYVEGTVTLGESLTLHDNVTIIRANGFNGPLFKIDTKSANDYVTLTSMTISGNGYGTLFDVESGRLRLRGNITLKDAAAALNITGGAVEVNKCSLGGTVSAKVAAAGAFIINNFGGSSVTGTVDLASGAKITLQSSLAEFANAINVTSADEDSEIVIAACSSSEIATNSVDKLVVNNGVDLIADGSNIVIL